jgi:tRNA-2-methylthio-N6-dimethylallyladenosine synthase
MSEELLRTVRDLPKCSPYLHVPAQSGSDAVLKRMKRGYSVADYLEMYERIERLLPNAAVSSDFIVGFCGETEDDFQQSMRLIERCRFKNSFIFQYSVRGGTKAAEMLEDDVPEGEKTRRNVEMLELQNRISLEANQAFIGQEVEILVEGPSKKSMKKGVEGPLLQMTGRTRCDRIVVFDGNIRQAGEFLPIEVIDVSSHTLLGRVVTHAHGPEVFQLTAP